MDVRILPHVSFLAWLKGCPYQQGKPDLSQGQGADPLISQTQISNLVGGRFSECRGWLPLQHSPELHSCTPDSLLRARYSLVLGPAFDVLVLALRVLVRPEKITISSGAI